MGGGWRGEKEGRFGSGIGHCVAGGFVLSPSPPL